MKKKYEKLKLHLLIMVLLLAIIPFVSLGFSALTTSLNIRGDVLVSIPSDSIIGNYAYSLSNSYLSASIKNKVKYISFENQINIPDNAYKTWDISASRNGKVMAYLVNNTDNASMFDLHIQGDNQIIANEDASNMFRYVNNVYTITNI